jgi:hypothetical protein
MDYYDCWNYKACPLEDLVGRVVHALKLSSDQQFLLVTHDEGQSVYMCTSECCSETWVADIIGVENLLEQLVVAAENIEVVAVDDGRTRQEADAFYGIKLETTRGYVEIIYRNSSNGAYDGDMKRYTGTFPPQWAHFKKMITITEDYSA